MQSALTFNDVSLFPIIYHGTPWIRAVELARALGLSREDKVAQIYQRHADEFTSDMTQLIENVAEPQNEVFPNLSTGRCRIFSLRGCHLVAMFSPQCLLDSLFQSRTEAEQRFRQALDDASLHLRLSLNVAVALGR